MAGGTAADTTPLATLAALQAEVAGLRQGLGLMLETQATHTEMLRQLLMAATPGEPETALADSLAQIAAILTRQSGALEAVKAILARLPQDVGQTVAQGVREVLRDV